MNSVSVLEFEKLQAQVQKLETRLNSLAKDLKTNASNVASDEDLDGQYGDPEIKYDPKEKYWTGPSYVGCRFSQCPADYLKATAKYLDACVYMAEKAGELDKARWKRLDAARARGWAERIANGYKAKAPSDAKEDGSYTVPAEDDIPF